MMQNPTKFGWMIKQGGGFKSWKRRFFMLVNDKLYYFEKENSKEPNGKSNHLFLFCVSFFKKNVLFRLHWIGSLVVNRKHVRRWQTELFPNQGFPYLKIHFEPRSLRLFCYI